MPGVDLDKVYADPEFQALSDDDKKAVMVELGYTGSGGGAGATISSREPDTLWDRARTAVMDAFVGSPEKQEARAEGIGTKTPAEMVWDALEAAPFVGAAATIGGVAAAPAVIPAVVGAATQYARGKIGGAAGHLIGGALGFPRTGAAIGSILAGGGAKKATDAAGKATKAVKAARVSSNAPAVTTGAIPASVPMPKVSSTGTVSMPLRLVEKAKAAPSTVVTKPPSELMAEAQKFESQIVNLRTTHGQSGAQIVNALKREHGISPGKGQKMVNAVLETHGLKKLPIEEAKIITTGGADPVTKSAMAFAREAVKSGNASGGNIHVLIENGQPVKVLTSAQAGAATRAGKEVTWIKNMWGGK